MCSKKAELVLDVRGGRERHRESAAYFPALHGFTSPFLAPVAARGLQVLRHRIAGHQDRGGAQR